MHQSGNRQTLTYSDAVNDNKNHVLLFGVDRDLNKGILSIDGIREELDWSEITGDVNSNQNYIIGGGHNNRFSGSEIQEIIIINKKTLTDSEIASIQYYLSKKWGLQSTVDSDGDNTVDANDAFPLDSSESIDSDGDGIGNNSDFDNDNDGYLNANDAFPDDASAYLDSDSDGYPDSFLNNATQLSNGYPIDQFPNDAAAYLDSDNDGYPDSFLNNATQLSDGTTVDLDDDNDGFLDTIEETHGSSPIDETSTPFVDFSDTVTNQIGNASGLDSIEQNISLWLDASNIDFQNNTRLTNGNSINTWLDLSGNKHNAVQESSNQQPIYNSNSLAFDGTDDYFAISSKSYQTESLENIHIFAVVQSSSDNQQIILSYDGSNYYHLSLHDGASTGVAFHTSSTSTDDLGSEAYNNGQTHIIHGSYEKNRTNYQKGIHVDGTLISNSSPHSEGIGTNVARFGFIGVGSEASEYNSTTGPNDFLNGNIYEIIMIEGELSTNQQSKITHYLSKKWNLESSVDSDDDGYKDTVDPNPVSGTDSTTLVTTGRIGMPTETITVQLIPTGNDIPTGLTFEITNQPSIGSAQVIADQASNSGYSLQYNPPNNANDYALEKVSINVGIIHSNGTKGASTTIPIYFYQFEINTNGNFFIPPGFARLDQTSIQVNDIIWNFNNIALNNIGNNQDNTIAEEIDNIPNDGNNIGNNSPISVFNLATNSDQLGIILFIIKLKPITTLTLTPITVKYSLKTQHFQILISCN